jgi:hypothetical protein
MKNDGGSAFPVVWDFGTGERGVNEGMTLRDYFAAKAMPSLVQEELVNGIWKHMCPAAMIGIASVAYEMADAMLKEREKCK